MIIVPRRSFLKGLAGLFVAQIGAGRPQKTWRKVTLGELGGYLENMSIALLKERPTSFQLSSMRD